MCTGRPGTRNGGRKRGARPGTDGAADEDNPNTLTRFTFYLLVGHLRVSHGSRGGRKVSKGLGKRAERFREGEMKN